SGRFVAPFPAQVADASALAASIGGAGAGLRYVDGPNAGQAYTGLALRTHLFNVHLNDLGNAVNDLSLARDFGSGDGGIGSPTGGGCASRPAVAVAWTRNSYVQSRGHRARL
ncbi:hypothetical protein, partial [Pantoea dispersa]